MESAISNPFAATQRSSDYRTGLDTDGGTLDYGAQTKVTLRASGVVTAGYAVVLDVPTQTLPTSVKLSNATPGAANLGIVEESGVAGDAVRVITEGPALAVAGGSISAGNAVASDANGKLVAKTMDASAVVGSVVGIALAGASANATFPVWVNRS